MKVFNKVALLSVGLMAAVAGLGACKSNAKMPVNFVAVTSSDYNATVQFGDYDYKFQGKVKQGSSSFSLVGTVVQRHLTASSGGGMGGFPGGGFPGGGPGGNSSGPAFEGFGTGEQQQPGGDQNPGGDFPGIGGGDQNPGGGDQNPGGGDQNPGGGDQGGFNPGGGNQGGFNPGGNQGGQGGQQQEEKVAPTSLSLSLDKAEAFINQAVTATVTVAPENADTSVTWATSDEKIATVNNGSISPIAEGTVTITATSTKDTTKSASATLKVIKEDLAQYNWSMDATCTYEKGYGYKIVFNDESKTEVHTDFDKTEGRHEFYYRVTIGQTSSVLKFQAKDPTFKDSLAKDYQKWDIRDSKYIFYAKATGNNNSVATAYMYLHNTNGEVTVNTPNGANRSLSFGMKWEEKDGVITVKDGETAYVADKSVNTEHPGYRLVYGGNAYYLSKNDNVKWKKMTTEDFDGATSYEFTGAYSAGMFGGQTDVNLNLGTDGVARLYVGSPAPTYKGTWSEDATTHKVTLTFGEHSCEFKDNANGTKSIVVVLQSTSMNIFTGAMETNTYNVEMSQVKPAQQGE